MISLLNFIDTGFIITLGLLLLVSGAIMLYCYRRLNILEDSVIQHGKILQNFIMNHNNQMMSYNQVFGGQSNFNSGGSNNLEKISEENEVEENEVEENEVEENEVEEGEEVEEVEVEEDVNNLKIVNLEDKIVVSDDESEESDSDSESDNESNDSENEDNDSENEDNDVTEDKMNKKENAAKEEDDFLNNIPIDLETLNYDLGALKAVIL